MQSLSRSLVEVVAELLAIQDIQASRDSLASLAFPVYQDFLASVAILVLVSLASVGPRVSVAFQVLAESLVSAVSQALVDSLGLAVSLESQDSQEPAVSRVLAATLAQVYLVSLESLDLAAFQGSADFLASADSLA